MIYPFFPYKEIRNVQSEMMADVKEAIKTRQNLLVHAPTGLGKTVASLAPALEYAEKYNKVVVFVTSRSSQHKMAIKTFNDILDHIKNNKIEIELESKRDRELYGVDLVGRQSMCLASNVSLLSSSAFSEYCKESREKRTCPFYNKIYKKDGALTPEAEIVINKFLSSKPNFVEDFILNSEGMCPYELASLLIKKSRLIVADFYHMFDPNIRSTLLKRIDKPIQDIILIVDEAHNLPKRIIDLMSSKLSSIVLERAIKEAKKEGYESLIPKLNIIYDSIKEMVNNIPSQSKKNDSFKQYPVRRETFTDFINYDLSSISKGASVEELIEELEIISDTIKDQKKNSYIGAVANFLKKWNGDNEGHIRYIEIEEDRIVLHYRGIDPSYLTSEVINDTHSTILMSGTLLPTEMYKHLLGVEDSFEKDYESPFPEENKSIIIVPRTTTLFKRRTPEEFKKIATICANIVKEVKGNSVIFFPSYGVLNSVSRYFKEILKDSNYKIFIESGDMTKKGKEGLLAEFKVNAVGHDMQRSLDSFTEKNKSVLLGVLSGSFAEGVDYPKNMVKGVLVVGVPLSKPDIVVKATMQYYNMKFGKGYEYAYIYPAMNKVMQGAGRGIRSENDVGVIVLIDERFILDDYLAYLPKTAVIDGENYLGKIKSFFKKEKEKN